jgi:pimeloyl-ACP methyl ester carboxylesterase
MAGPPPLLLIPGLLCTEAVWGRVVAALAGTGVSARLLPWRVTTSAPTLAGVAAAALEQAGAERVAVAGFSYGGYVALEMARQAPARVAALALVSSQARPDADAVKARRRAQMQAAQAAGSVAPVLAHHVPALLHPRHLPPGLADDPSLLTPAGAERVAGGFPAFACAVRMAHEVGVGGLCAQQEAIISRADGRGVLAAWAASRKPFAAVCGGMDALIPVRAQREAWRTVWHGRHARHAPAAAAAAAAAESEGVRVGGDEGCRWRAIGPMGGGGGGGAGGVGHMSPLEAGEEVAEVLRAMMAQLV